MTTLLELEPAIIEAAAQGRLVDILSVRPRAWWRSADSRGHTLLHYACQGDNIVAVRMLLVEGIDPNVRNDVGSTPAHTAALHGKAELLEALLAAGANARATNHAGDAPLDLVLRHCRSPTECVRVLVSNGVQLQTAHNPRVPLDMVQFQIAVGRCRSVVLSLLRVKKAARLVRWDKFLLKEIALAVWSERRSESWKKSE